MTTEPKKKKKKVFRVLSIDGGGMRGLYTTVLLDRLNQNFSKMFGKESLDVGKGFDLIVGTSTGGIIATCLAFGVDTRGLVEFYRKLGPKLFTDPVPNDNGKNLLSPLFCWVLRNWKKAPNSPDELRKTLEKFFQETTLADLYEQRGIRLCMPAVNLNTNHSIMFKTPHAHHRHHYPNYKLVDICMGATASPILFPIAMVDDHFYQGAHKTFVDGALWANNPIMLAITESLCESDGYDSIHITSIGTCNPPGGATVTKEHKSWGIKDWMQGTKFINLILEVESYAYERMARKIAKHLDKKCDILRLPHTAPSALQAKYLQMDSARPETIQVLIDLGTYDAEQIFTSILDGNKDLLNLKRRFEKMPEFVK